MKVERQRRGRHVVTDICMRCRMRWLHITMAASAASPEGKGTTQQAARADAAGTVSRIADGSRLHNSPECNVRDSCLEVNALQSEYDRPEGNGKASRTLCQHSIS